MLIVRWKIGKKPRGRWRPPLNFEVEFTQSEELTYRPRLVFIKEYDLPGKIFTGGVAMRDGGNICKEKDKIKIYLDMHISEPVKMDTRSLLINCTSCSNCNTCLEWRPGKPDYSDFEKVFQQIATDLVETWNKAVEEARASEEYEGEENIVTTESIFRKKEEEKLSEKPVRKLRIV